MKRMSLLCIGAFIVSLALTGCNNRPHTTTITTINTEPVVVDSQPPAGGTPVVGQSPQITAEDELILKQIIDLTEWEMASGAPLPALRRRASIFGDNYPGTQMPLSGCVLDAKHLALYAYHKKGYKIEEIRLILNKLAICANYHKYVKWATDDGVDGDDNRLIGNSSHGTQVTGEGSATEPDKLNEMWVPYDLDWNNPNTWFTDKSINKYIKNFNAKSNLTVIGTTPVSTGVLWITSDSCNSGDAIRDFGWNKKPGTIAATKKTVSRFLPPPPFMAARIAKSIAFHGKAKAREFANMDLNVGYGSGCKSSETSADTQDDFGQPCGAYTDMLLKELYKDDTRPFNVIIEAVNREMDRYGYSQNPQAEGGRVRQPFMK